jgi:hypothetical protein
VTGRRGRRGKQLLGDLKETRRYWKLKEEALDCTLWRTRFGRVYGPLVRRTTQTKNIGLQILMYWARQLCNWRLNKVSFTEPKISFSYSKKHTTALSNSFTIHLEWRLITRLNFYHGLKFLVFCRKDGLCVLNYTMSHRTECWQFSFLCLSHLESLVKTQGHVRSQTMKEATNICTVIKGHVTSLPQLVCQQVLRQPNKK